MWLLRWLVACKLAYNDGKQPIAESQSDMTMKKGIYCFCKLTLTPHKELLSTNSLHSYLLLHFSLLIFSLFSFNLVSKASPPPNGGQRKSGVSVGELATEERGEGPSFFFDETADFCNIDRDLAKTCFAIIAI